MRRYGILKKVFQKHKFLNEANAKRGVHDFVLVLDGLKPDYNVGKAFRSADAFGAREIHLVNVPFFNVFPSRGSFKHVPAKFHSNFQEVYNLLSPQGYTFVTLEPSETTTLFEARFPQKVAFVFGHEEYGLSFKREDFPGVQGVSIPQYGKVQSLNVSVAASLVMFEYVRQLKTTS
jgi:tRNA G18 (ribose-2'-O)-methylase SpoU